MLLGSPNEKTQTQALNLKLNRVFVRTTRSNSGLVGPERQRKKSKRNKRNREEQKNGNSVYIMRAFVSSIKSIEYALENENIESSRKVFVETKTDPGIVYRRYAAVMSCERELNAL